MSQYVNKKKGLSFVSPCDIALIYKLLIRVLQKSRQQKKRKAGALRGVELKSEKEIV